MQMIPISDKWHNCASFAVRTVLIALIVFNYCEKPGCEPGEKQIDE